MQSTCKKNIDPGTKYTFTNSSPWYVDCVHSIRAKHVVLCVVTDKYCFNNCVDSESVQEILPGCKTAARYTVPSWSVPFGKFTLVDACW